MNSRAQIPEELWERIRNLPRSNEGLIVSCIFEKDLPKLNNKKRTTLNRLNFYIKYKVGGSFDPRNQGYYSVKSIYYNHSNTTGIKDKFTFNNPAKYSIISDFSEYDDISLFNNDKSKYADEHKTIGNSIQVLNWIYHGHYDRLDRLIPIQISRLRRPPAIIDTVVFVDLNDYSKIDIVYDHTGKIHILKKFADKARYWSKERLKAQEEFSPERLKSQGYFDSDSGISEQMSNLNLNSFGKKKNYSNLISFERYLHKLK